MAETIAMDLRYHSGRYHSDTPLLPGRELARSHRRRLAQGSQVHASLSGDLVSRGYFSADLLVGTPPQRFSVIVDTGSSVTAIACTGCTRCGRHANPRFAPSSSTTFEPVTCSSDTECSRCNNGVCGYRVSYQEGSSYSGFLVRDVVRMGVGGSCASLYLQFGCSTEESGLFKLQRADGIMGLASSMRALPTDSKDDDDDTPSTGSGTVLEALVERGYVQDAFSVCIAATHGVLTFGLPPAHPLPEPQEPEAGARQPIFWTAVADALSYYSVNVLSVSYGAVQLAPTEARRYTRCARHACCARHSTTTAVYA